MIRRSTVDAYIITVARISLGSYPMIDLHALALWRLRTMGDRKRERDVAVYCRGAEFGWYFLDSVQFLQRCVLSGRSSWRGVRD
jgi:hypothetical protein